jgi:menaquinone-dependent protoporphyrinogen oxidase
MTVLVAYASKHGSTQGIAERIVEKLRQLGKQAEARLVEEASDPGSYKENGTWAGNWCWLL